MTYKKWKFNPEPFTKEYIDYLDSFNCTKMFENCVPLKDYKAEMTNEIRDMCCDSCIAVANNFSNSYCSVASNAASKEDLIDAIKAVETDIKYQDKEIEKLSEEMKSFKNNVSWQTICLYVTWAMLIVIGFMIYFKSFDVSVEVNNPIQNQEVILEPSK